MENQNTEDKKVSSSENVESIKAIKEVIVEYFKVKGKNDKSGLIFHLVIVLILVVSIIILGICQILEGATVGTQALQQQKIEELTLYIIQLQKQVEELNVEIQLLKK